MSVEGVRAVGRSVGRLLRGEADDDDGRSGIVGREALRLLSSLGRVK